MSQPNPAPTPVPAASAPPDTDVSTVDEHDETATDTRNPALAEARRESMRWKRQAREFQAELDKLKAASQSETERAIAAAKAEGGAQYKAMWAKAQAENAALTVLSRKGVVATELALRALDLADVTVDERGRVDLKEIEGRVDELLERYPVLTPTPNSAPPVPLATGGGQRRVTESQLATTNDREKLNQQLRWALGGHD